MRLLQFESLERRDLLSANFDWPHGVGVKGVFEDGGYALSSNKVGAEAAMIGISREQLATSSYTLTRNVMAGSSSDLNGVLEYPDGQNAFAVLYHNGGGSSPHQSALGSTGRKNIIDFVEQGGSYVGSCAGLWTAKNLGLYPGGASQSGGSGTQVVQFKDDGNYVSEALKAAGLPLRMTVTHQGGPALQPWSSRPSGAEFMGDVIGGYPSRTRGSDIIVSWQPDDGSGSRELTTSHPEYGRTQAQTVVMAAMLRHAYDNAKVTPTVKGDLEYGQTVAMVGATEKLGDGQYHRYAMQVEPGTRELTITSDNMSGTELYVTFNGAAYDGGSDYSGDVITIQNPAAGEWEVSILGTHQIKNGVAYSITVDAAVGPLPNWWTVEFESVANPWQNPVDRFDVNGDGVRSPLDAMILINAINASGSLVKPLPAITTWPLSCLDVRDDGQLDLYDVLDVLMEIL